jgi:radical SAM protein with 4Fe4S-binding SPASM domain
VSESLAAPSAPELTDTEWATRLTQRFVRERVPISGLLELTSRCNLRCVHCYLGPQKQHWDPARRSRELSLEQLRGIIDQIAEAGCLYLGITGGDPMVHEHFPEVYRHARQRGLLVTVLCNGILVRDEIVELFREYPPLQVEVSLYGATRATYEAVTEVPGSYTKCLKGIRKLLANGINVQLKTVLMKLNGHEVGEMRRLAAGFGLELRVDGAIFPQLTDQDQKPLAQRLTPEQVVEYEFADRAVAEAWREHAERVPVPAESLYRCGAGVTGFYIDPFGNVSPCIMTTHKKQSLLERSFASLWARELEQIRSVKPRAEYGCNSCEMQMACTSCPGFNYQENGHDDVKSEYVCETTRVRWNRIQLEREQNGERLPPATDRGGWAPLSWGARRESAVSQEELIG